MLILNNYYIILYNMLYKCIILLFFVYPILGFMPTFRKYEHLLKCSNDKEPENEEVKILNIDFANMIDKFDQEILAKIHNNNIPISPEKEEDIIEDSFEGYLRRHFRIIANKNGLLPFKRFYLWRNQIGTVLTYDELNKIFNSISEIENECNLMNFILINKIIDENDGADFS